MSIYEYDEEKTMRQLKEEYLEEGRREGHLTGREEGCLEGRESGIREGICAFIEGFTEEGFSEEQIVEKLVSKFSLTREQAETYCKNNTTK